jgi:hypothetical protein
LDAVNLKRFTGAVRAYSSEPPFAPSIACRTSGIGGPP